MSLNRDLADALRQTLADTTARQREASDPTASVWVSANAGTGKTHVLTMRTLRLLLAGTPPERILCLTYTKAAAAEMATRVFSRLARWVTEANSALEDDLEKLLGRTATADECLTARTLFARAIETPGGLKVQTIHAFCERLLQRFPMEAGVAPGFQTLDDDLGRELKREAIERTLGEALADEGSDLGKALHTAIAFAAEQRFEDLLSQAIGERDWLAELDQYIDAGDNRAALDRHEAVLRTLFELEPGLDLAVLRTKMDSVLSAGELSYAAQVLGEGTRTDQGNAAIYAAIAASKSQTERIGLFKTVLLTEKNEPRKRLMTKGPQERDEGFHAKLLDARDRMAEYVRQELGVRCLQATLALLLLAGRVRHHYTQAKAGRAALDFDDLIERTVALLGDREATDWVLYKLDGGIDHILVDESQDTSPDQWRIVESLAAEFFAGAGAQETDRTLFAVGDEKQSIYSFQGAAPEMFSAMGEKFAQLSRASGRTWREVPLDLSFRTVAPLLGAVDQVFEDAARAPGLSSAGRSIHHAVKRLGEGGLVEVWSTERPADVLTTEAFDPLAEQAVASPVERLSKRIAETIAGFVETGEILASKGRPIRPGDILILCRKRQPFAAPMVAALKAHNIPVAGADRLILSQQLAVQDLMALGQFTTLPDDDLTLAALLKSPLIGFDDDLLFEVAYKRKSSLWKAMIDARSGHPRIGEAVRRLAEWRNRADFLPPFEFYAKALEEDGLRHALISRLGHEAADPIDEFLNLAIAYDDREAPSLTGFLNWLGDGEQQIKRDMEQGADEVRVMTVHASKGLEAPIVFLPDTCSPSASGGSRDPLTRLDPASAAGSRDNGVAYAWTIKGASDLDAIQAAKRAKARRETEEHNRLLYVAMTRAEDRLYVCGFEGAKGRGAGCWYDLIRDGLKSRLEEAVLDGEDVVWRLASPQEVKPAGVQKPSSIVASAKPPAWARSPAPRVAHVSLPLAPSQLAPFEADEEGEPVAGPVIRAASNTPPVEPAATTPLAAAEEDGKFLRGTLTHALFEHLPALEPDLRREAARAFLALRGAALPGAVQNAISNEVLGILEAPDYAALFSPRSRAEVAIAADLIRPDGKAPNLRLSGSIDRLIDTGDTVLIVDYKTNRDIPADPDATPEAYLLQLAAYRLALREIYPGRTIRAALLWTRLPRMMEIGAEALDRSEASLWEVSREAA